MTSGVGAEWAGNNGHDTAAGWPEEERGLDTLCAVPSQYAVCQPLQVAVSWK
jgi:hypothetical protein